MIYFSFIETFIFQLADEELFSGETAQPIPNFRQ